MMVVMTKGMVMMVMVMVMMTMMIEDGSLAYLPLWVQPHTNLDPGSIGLHHPQHRYEEIKL